MSCLGAVGRWQELTAEGIEADIKSYLLDSYGPHPLVTTYCGLIGFISS